MIRISTRKENDCTAVTIDGQLTDSDLRELQRVRKTTKGKVILNLRELSMCAACGVQELLAWLDAGAQLQDATPFLWMILEKKTK